MLHGFIAASDRKDRLRSRQSRKLAGETSSRSRPWAGSFCPEDGESLGFRERQRPQQDSTHHAEDRHVGADAEGQGEPGDERERRRPGQHAPGVSKVLSDVHLEGRLLTQPCGVGEGAEAVAYETGRSRLDSAASVVSVHAMAQLRLPFPTPAPAPGPWHEQARQPHDAEGRSQGPVERAHGVSPAVASRAGTTRSTSAKRSSPSARTRRPAAVIA